MNNQYFHNHFGRAAVLLLCFYCLPLSSIFAQFGNNTNNNNDPFNTNTNDPNDPFGQDSSLIDSKKKWENIPAKIHYTTSLSEIQQSVDSSLSLLHRNLSKDGWYYHLGNYGTPAVNMYFDAARKLGPQLGYRIFEPYQMRIEDVKYYHTTRPFSEFIYSLGSKQEQIVSILHTQNINQYWNIAVQVRNNNSQGFFQNQSANYNGGMISSNYKSKNNRYLLKAALVYNNNRADENGGITADSLLTNSNIPTRALIPTLIGNNPYSNKRSTVLNKLRTVDIAIENKYQWGIADTTYNADSTAMYPRFTPRYGVKHQLNLNLHKHTFEDKFPNIARYPFIDDPIEFVNADTNKTNQQLNTVENKFAIFGYFGKSGHQSLFKAGIANRLDFVADKIPNNNYKTTLVNNYLFGKIQKEALDSFQWSYQAAAAFYFAGSAIGDFSIDGFISKNIRNIGGLKLRFKQTLSEPALAYTRFATNYYVVSNEWSKQSSTYLAATLYIDKLGLQVTGSNVLAGNYIYLDNDWKVQQYNSIFNVIQVQATHDLRFGHYRTYSEALIQQVAGNAPINIPLVMLRHISSYENKIFDNKLLFNAGLEIRYHTPFTTAGYSPYFNQFTYRTGATTQNVPEVLIFASFRVKQFRMHASMDQLQQYLFKKNVMHFANYPMQDALFRFGFDWILYN